MVGNTVVLADDRGTETHLPLTEVYLISSQPRKKDKNLLRAGLWTLSGAHVGFLAGLMTGSTIFPEWSYNDTHATRAKITSLVGLAVGASVGLAVGHSCWPVSVTPSGAQ